MAALRGQRVCGVFPLYRLHGERHRGAFISVPFAVAGGVVSDSEEAERALVENALLLAKREGVGSIVFKQYKHKVAGDLRADATFYNRELSLSAGLDEAWKGLATENKSMISSARESGFTLEYPSRDVAAFYPVLLAHHHREGVPCVSKEWIRHLIASGMYTLALARLRGRPVAGTLVKTFKKTASFPFTALRKNDDTSVKAVYWLYWELISLFAGKGLDIIHSGRIPADESVPRFRLGWGGVKYPYFYQYHPNSNQRTEFKLKRGLKRRAVSVLWRLTPQFITAKLGPLIVRRFP
jgi:hypothetical protein